MISGLPKAGPTTWLAIGVCVATGLLGGCSTSADRSLQADSVDAVAGPEDGVQRVVFQNRTGWAVQVGQCTNDLIGQHFGYAGNCHPGVSIPNSGQAMFTGDPDHVVASDQRAEPVQATTRVHLRIYRGQHLPPWDVDLEVSDSGPRGSAAAVQAPNVWMTRQVDRFNPWRLSVRGAMSVTTRRLAGAGTDPDWIVTVTPPTPGDRVEPTL